MGKCIGCTIHCHTRGRELDITVFGALVGQKVIWFVIHTPSLQRRCGGARATLLPASEIHPVGPVHQSIRQAIAIMENAKLASSAISTYHDIYLCAIRIRLASQHI
jgi:hypothetical protein